MRRKRSGGAGPIAQGALCGNHHPDRPHLACRHRGPLFQINRIPFGPEGFPLLLLIGLVLGLAAPLVVAFQIVRILIVVTISGLVFRHALHRRPPMN